MLLRVRPCQDGARGKDGKGLLAPQAHFLRGAVQGAARTKRDMGGRSPSLGQAVRRYWDAFATSGSHAFLPKHHGTSTTVESRRAVAPQRASVTRRDNGAPFPGSWCWPES